MKVLAKGRGVEIQATGQMTTNWDDCRKRIAVRIERATRAAADVLMAASLELIPTETSAAKDSGKVRKKQGGLKSEFIIGYGSVLFTAASYGEARQKRPPHLYVVYLHEDLRKAHLNGTAKFLEKPYYDKRAEMRAALREQL